MQRFHEQVNFEPKLDPVHFKDTIICYKDSTRKRYVSNTYYEPRVKPRTFADTLVIYPKRPEKLHVSCLDYHIDECRRWFKTCMEFTAKTYTAKRIINNSVSSNSEGEMEELDDDQGSDGPGASQIFMPRFNRDNPYVQVLLTVSRQLPFNFHLRHSSVTPDQ